MSTCAKFLIPIALIGLLPAVPAAADTTFFNTGNPDGRIATATRPESAGGFEIESADDFILGTHTSITGATFTGLLTNRAPLTSVGEVRVEIYRVFPNNSDIGRTSGSPPFSTPQVPARLNSPSDNALDTRNSTSGLTFTKVDKGVFEAFNSVQPGGIHPDPNVHTGGDGKIAGEEVRFDLTFSPPSISLLVTISLCLRSRSRIRAGVSSCGCLQRNRSPAALGLLLGTCRSGPAMQCLIPTGCVSARTSWAARRLLPSTRRSRYRAPRFPSLRPGR